MKHLKISTQLKLGLTILVLFAIVQCTIAYIQTDKIDLQTKLLYQHPLLVQQSIDQLKVNILTIQRNMKDIFIVENKDQIETDLNQNEVLKHKMISQIDNLYNKYLGPRTDIDSVLLNIILWNSMRDETIRLFREGKISEASVRSSSIGIAGNEVEQIFNSMAKVDNFARLKSEELVARSDQLNNSLNNMLIMFGAANVLIAVIFYLMLYNNIRKPLEEITNATQKFHEGHIDARSSFESKNIIGILSGSFNSLAQSIQNNLELKEKVTELASLMLSEDDAKAFFRKTLTSIAADTDSQMAAVYLLSDDKKTFEHFESIGLDKAKCSPFSAENFEGEFGSVLSSKKIRHIKNIPEDARFVFNTVIGKFFPREIISIPIITNNNVIAVISIASINDYGINTIQLIENIHSILCSRIEGILAYRTIKEFSKLLEHQNSELETQKTELSVQASELSEQNTELEMQKKQIEEVSRLKTSFLSNMSHELRTPLNSVIALSGVLSRRLANKIPDDEYSYLEIIERNGKHLLSLINDILDISRIEAGGEEIEITEFNANSIAAEVANMIRPQAEEKNISLLHTNSETSLVISCDSHKLRHILQNLIGNAVKFTEKGKVEITARRNGKNIEIAIADTGIGISPDHLLHIFDEFRQADSSTSRKFGGTGLGLTIAKKYANLLGGEITVTSVPDKGSEFILTLPLIFAYGKRIEHQETNAGFNNLINPSPYKPFSDLSSKTILLVEDSEPAIIQIKDFLEESGYNILVARDGSEALEIIGHTIPDAMILDLMMPEVDGFEVLKSIHESEQTIHIPVLILTAKHVTKEELRFLQRNNIRQLIQKGDVNRNNLLKAVAAMVFTQPEETLKPQRMMQTIQGKAALLVVEDNPDNMITVKALLDDNFIVIEAMDGIEAIELAVKHVPDLILLDIALPEMDGIETFRAIRKLPNLQNIPVIALTASAMTEDRGIILAYGFDGYISKPIDERVFFKTINEILYGK